MKMMRNTAALAGAVCLLATQASVAQAPVAVARLAAPTTADSLHLTRLNKQRLVEQQLTQSPAALRIRQSKHAQANKLLAQAQGYYTKAREQSDVKQAQAAIELLDEALRQFVAASRLVPDVTHQVALERHQNTQLREALGIFQVLHKNHSSRMERKKAQTATVAIDRGRIEAMVAQADVLITSGKQREANRLLNDAYRLVVSTLSDMLAAETIVYDLKFDTPVEEYRHELARNLGYEELIPIALVQMNTAAQSVVLAERHVQQSRHLRQVAHQQVGGGDYAGAMKTMQDATEQLQRALRVAGVVVPQTTEFTR